MSADTDPDADDIDADDIDAVESLPLRAALLTYGAPFVGALLITVGIVGGVLGGYAVVQQELDLCGDPTIAVSSAADTENLLSGPNAPVLDRLAFEELSPAERRAFERALDAEDGRADVRGAFPHEPAFRDGVVVEYRGEVRYATVVSSIECLSVDPLVLPLGVVAILLGVGGVLTPPAYRALLAREERGGPWSR